MNDALEMAVNQAIDAYNNAEFREAIVLGTEARLQATTLGHAAMAFSAGVIVAQAQRRLGDYTKALALLIQLLSSVPPSAEPNHLWSAHNVYFDIVREKDPSAEKLARVLNDLDRLSGEITCPPADLPHERGHFAADRGRSVEALRHFEQAWTLHDGLGRTRVCLAHSAALECLSLGQLEHACSWRDKLCRPDIAPRNQAHDALRSLNSCFALFTQDPRDLATALDDPTNDACLLARVHLLTNPGDAGAEDPTTKAHSARAQLRKGPEKSRNVHSLYFYRLAIVDYHLASLRFAAGLPAIDDLYYRKPDSIPSRIDLAAPDLFAIRLRRFDRAWQRLRVYADWLDRRLECDWRTKAAEARRRRRDALAEAVNAADARSESSSAASASEVNEPFSS